MRFSVCQFDVVCLQKYYNKLVGIIRIVYNTKYSLILLIN